MESAGILSILLFILHEGFRQVFHEAGQQLSSSSWKSKSMALSFLDLPVLVLDNILRYVDYSAYLPLCLTCKALHWPAKEMLYRFSAYTKNKGPAIESFHEDKVLLSQKLRGERSLCEKLLQGETGTYARYIRYYSARDPEACSYLLQRVPLYLYRLILQVDPKYWMKAPIVSVHPATVVEELDIVPVLYSEYDQYLHVPNLTLFHGLVSLKIGSVEALAWRPASQITLDHLCCPQLRRLELGAEVDDWKVIVGDNLPHLESIRFTIPRDSAWRHKRLIDQLPQLESWLYLQRYVERGLHVRIADRGDRDEESTFRFLNVALLFGSETEARQVYDWLLRGAKYFWPFLADKLSYSFDFKGFEANTRDLSLKLLKQLPFLKTPHLTISLWSSDTALLLPSLMELIPKRTCHFEVYLQDEVDADILPSLVSSLDYFEKLTHFTCNLASRVVRGGITPWPSARVIDFSLAMTKFRKQMDIDRKRSEFLFSNEFLFDRKDGFTWTHVKHFFLEKEIVGPIRRKGITFDIYEGTLEMRKATKEWFKRHPSLQEIKITAWGWPSYNDVVFPFDKLSCPSGVMGMNTSHLT